MALKTAVDKPEVSPAPTAPTTTVLELALYTKFTWGDTTYKKGVPYRFKNAEAMRLLAEHDLGRPIWSIYRPPPQVRSTSPEDRVVDATAVKAPVPTEDHLPGTVTQGRKRIEVGTDDEIADVLSKVEGDEGNVTV